LSLPDGRLLCGATAHRAETEAALREADTTYNLGRLKALTGIEPGAGAACGGRVGWRLGTVDRLPVVGAWPDTRAAARGRREQARWVPRLPGLFVAGGFGSRGLTWAPLAAEVLAGWIDGTPLPLEAELLDAIDPARGLVRAARRAVAD
jgi:tRNA 5-methylaminomethyl-2-thiouridine biosynthesis bifunctional protein